MIQYALKNSRIIASLLLLSFCACPFAMGAKGDTFQTDPEMKVLRKEAVERPRRVLYNNDGCDAVSMDEYSIDEFLTLRSKQLIDTHVDAIMYCTYSSGLDIFTHNTKIGTVLTNRERHPKNKVEEFLRHGTDPLREMVKFAHQYEKEIFWSLRMNDTHDGSTQSYGPILFKENRLKTAHPEWLLGSEEKPPLHGKWTGLNYEIPEVCDRVVRLIEEVCQNYDIDGVELDFFRHPTFFEYPDKGKGVTKKQLKIMTDLMRRVRMMIDAEAQKRGRPILVAMKMPDSLEFCRAIGIDLERWLADDLLDILVVSSYLRLNEWDYSVTLGHKYGVKVYPSLDEPRVEDKQAYNLRRTANCYRGRAAEVHASGADGVYLYNFFRWKDKSPYEVIKQAGDPTVLARLDKDYFGSVLGKARVAGGAFPHAKFINIETLNPGDPKKLKPGESAEAKLFIADDFSKVPPKTLRLGLRFADAAPGGHFKVFINGTPLAETPEGENDWLWFELPTSVLRPGSNVIRLRLERKAAPVTWTDLLLQVRASRLGDAAIQ